MDTSPAILKKVTSPCELNDLVVFCVVPEYQNIFSRIALGFYCESQTTTMSSINCLHVNCSFGRKISFTANNFDFTIPSYMPTAISVIWRKICRKRISDLKRRRWVLCISCLLQKFSLHFAVERKVVNSQACRYLNYGWDLSY